MISLPQFNKNKKEFISRDEFSKKLGFLPLEERIVLSVNISDPITLSIFPIINGNTVSVDVHFIDSNPNAVASDFRLAYQDMGVNSAFTIFTSSTTPAITGNATSGFDILLSTTYQNAGTYSLVFSLSDNDLFPQPNFTNVTLGNVPPGSTGAGFFGVQFSETVPGTLLAYPTITTALPATLPASTFTVGTDFTDTATVTGYNIPTDGTDTVTFNLSGPNNFSAIPYTTTLTTTPPTYDPIAFLGMPLSPGMYTITATFNGDANNHSVTSASETVTISAAAPTITVTPENITTGQQEQVTATLTGGYNVSGENVSFYLDNSLIAIGTAPLGTEMNGVATATLDIPNLTAGIHTVNAIYIGDTNNTTTSATNNFTVTPGDNIVITLPTTLNATEGVATQTQAFSGTDTNDPNASLSASVNWGDGTPNTTFNLAVTTGAFSGTIPSHTYADESTGQLTLTITGPNGSGSASETVTVADAKLTQESGAVQVPIIENHSFSTVLGTFEDANPTAPIADYSATVTWGDGNTDTTAGTNLQILDTHTQDPVTHLEIYEVLGTHTYTSDGTFNIGLTVNDRGGASLTFANEGSLHTSVLWGLDANGDLFSIGDYNQAATTTLNYGHVYLNVPILNHSVLVPLGNIDGFAVNSSGTAYLVINNAFYNFQSLFTNESLVFDINLMNVTLGKPTIANLVGYVNEGGLPLTREIESIAFNHSPGPNQNTLYALVQEGGNYTAEQLATLNIDNVGSNQQIPLNRLGPLTGSGVTMTSDQGQALVFDPSGNLYVSDSKTETLYQIYLNNPNHANGSIEGISNNEASLGKNADITAMAWNPLASNTTNQIIAFNDTNNTLDSLASNGDSTLASMSQSTSLDVLDDVVGLDFYI